MGGIDKMRKNEDIKKQMQDKKRITQILYIIQYGNTNQYNPCSGFWGSGPHFQKYVFC